MGCLKSPSHPCKCCTSRNCRYRCIRTAQSQLYPIYIYTFARTLSWNSILHYRERKTSLEEEAVMVMFGCGSVYWGRKEGESKGIVVIFAWISIHEKLLNTQMEQFPFVLKKVIRILIYVNVKIIIRNKFNLSTIYILFFFLQMKNNAIQIYILVFLKKNVLRL